MFNGDCGDSGDTVMVGFGLSAFVAGSGWGQGREAIGHALNLQMNSWRGNEALLHANLNTNVYYIVSNALFMYLCLLFIYLFLLGKEIDT